METKIQKSLEFKEMAQIAERKFGKPCKTCLGLGQVGWNVSLELYMPCECVLKAAKEFEAEKRKEKGVSKLNPKIPHEQLVLMHTTNLGYFDKLWKRGEENERYFSVDHFTDEEKQDYVNEGRYPFSMPMTAHKLNNIISSEKESRTSFKVEAKSDPNDEIKAELATLRLRNIEQNSGLKYIESDVFTSGVAIIYGVVKLKLDYDDEGNRIILFEEVDYKNFIWDSNAKKYEKDDAVFMAEMRKAYRYQLAQEYGEDKVSNLQAGQIELWQGRPFVEYFVQTNMYQQEYDLITVFTHYQKVMRDYWCLYFKGQKVGEYRTKKEAEEYQKMLLIPFLSEGMPEPPNKVVKNPKVKMDKYVFTYSDILEYEETEYDFFPYSVYQSFQFKDKIWSMSDILKSPQIFIDRLIAQSDYSLGKDIKDGFEVVVPKLAEGITVEEAVQRAKDGEGVPVMMDGAIKWIERHSLDSNWLNIYEIMLSLGEDVSGGRSFSGLQDKAGESGIAIKQKVMQGEKLTALFIDNKFRMKRDIGNKALSFMALYDTEPYVMKVLGGSLTPEMVQLLQMHNIYQPSEVQDGVGYVTINKNPQSSMEWLKDRKFELQIVEDDLSESRREVKYMKMLQAEQSRPELKLSPTWNMELFTVMDLDYSLRQRLVTELQQMMQQQQQMQQQQAQSEQQDKAIDTAKFLVEQENKKNEKQKAAKKN